MKIEWTKTPPKIPGIYWCYDATSPNRPYQLAQVMKVSNGVVVIVGAVFHWDLGDEIYYSTEPVDLPAPPKV